MKKRKKLTRYILTGTPGCGKTSIIKALQTLKATTIDEAATDIIYDKQKQGINEPWKNKTFIDEVINLQKQRQINLTNDDSNIQFYDRSPICTYALSRFLNSPPSPTLCQEIKRIIKNNIYENNVFFIDNLGFIETTDVRKINFKDSLTFEKLHLETYKQFGFNCIHVPINSIQDRAKNILKNTF